MTSNRLELERPILTIFVKLGGQNRPNIDEKSISETKMGSPGEKSLPKVAPSHPKTRKVVQNDPQSGAKVAQSHPKTRKRVPNEPKVEQKWSKIE